MGEMDEILPALEAYLEPYSRSDFVCAMVPIPPAGRGVPRREAGRRGLA